MPTKNKKTVKKIIAWSEIKAIYRAGLFSNRQLAIKFDIAESTLRAKIKKEDWKKDLAKQVSSSVKDKLSRLVGNEVLALDDDQEVVEKVANEKVSILKGHRTSLTKLHGIIGLLGERLESQLNRDRLTVEMKGEATDIDIPLDYVGKVVGHYSKSMKDLIELERKTYGHDDEQSGGGSYDENVVKLAEQFQKAQADEESLLSGR